MQRRQRSLQKENGITRLYWYTTLKFAKQSRIHPSKRPRINTEVTYGSCSTTGDPKISSNESTAENNDSSSSEYTPENLTSKQKHHSSKSASGHDQNLPYQQDRLPEFAKV